MATKNSFNEGTRNGFNESKETVINSLQTGFGKMARVAVVMAAIAMASATPASAQVHFGVKGGVTTMEMKDKTSLLDSKKHTAYTGGLMLDLNIPKVNLGLEVSAMYRQNKNPKIDQSIRRGKNHCIDIPVYARYRLAIPGVEKVVAPVVFTGPNISVVIPDKNIRVEGVRKTYLSWDVGAGVDLFKHVRVTASYGIGMKRAMDVVGKDYSGHPVEGKDDCWTVSAAVMF